MRQPRELSELRNPLNSTCLYTMRRHESIKEPVTLYCNCSTPRVIPTLSFSICQISSVDHVLDDLSANIIEPVILAHTLHTTNDVISILFHNTRGDQRAIASTLRLPRSTVQSAIYAMTGTSRKRQNRKQILITRVQNHAPAATTSSSAIYTSPAPYMATQMLPDIRQSSLYYLPSVALTVRPLTMPKCQMLLVRFG